MATSAAKSKKSDNLVLRGLGILGLLGICGSHLEYWYNMFRPIPFATTISGLFEFTFIFAFVLAIVMVVFPRALIAVAAAGFAFATLGGYLLSLFLSKGIFGYHDLGISYSGGIAIGSEVIGGLALLAWGGTRLLGGRTAKASSLPFGATAADAPAGAKAAKAAKPAKAAKAARKAPASVPFGATAADMPSLAKASKSAKPDKPAKPAKPAKAAKARTGRGPSSVQAQIEQAQASFQTGASPPSGPR